MLAVSRQGNMKQSIDKDYLVARRYDQYYGAYATLPNWFINELSTKKGVLELACGTGRIAIPLAQNGLAVTGIDYSKPMLDLAKSKADDKQMKVEWVLGDIRCFDLGRKYQVILLLFNALWHLHEVSDIEDCLQCVQHHLTSDGLFILDVFVPDMKFLNRGPSRRYAFHKYIDDETGKLVKVTESIRYEANTQIARVVHYKENSEDVVGDLNLRMYFPKELDALLKYNGMKIKNKFGNWDRDAFGLDSKHQLYFCTTTKTG